MRNGFLRDLALAAAAGFVTMAWVSGAGAAVSISSCGVLSTTGQTYNVSADLSSCGSCLVVAANHIVINLQGHTISSACFTGGGVSDEDIAREATVVKNGSITGFEDGILLASSSKNIVLSIDSFDNLLVGIWLGDFSLVKASAAAGNVVGILVGDRSQVEVSDASFNFLDGIFAGNFCLIHGNTANNNGEEGITTGGFCTVTFNTANNNFDDGIDVGADESFNGTKSLVTGNTANNNGDVGIEAPCPSDVQNNTASGNALNYNLFPSAPGAKACFTKNNQ